MHIQKFSLIVGLEPWQVVCMEASGKVQAPKLDRFGISVYTYKDVQRFKQCMNSKK